MKRLLAILFCSLLSFSTYAQIGQFLKDKVNKAKDKLEESRLRKIRELQDKQNYSDTTAFNLAISLSDNAAFFDSDKDRTNLFLSGLKQISRDDIELNKAENVMNLNREGENLFRFRKFGLAEIDFATALSLYFIPQNSDFEDFELFDWESKIVRAAMVRKLLKQGTIENVNPARLDDFNFYAFSRTLSNLSLIQFTRGQFSSAEKFANFNVTILQKRVGKQHVATAAAMNNLATIFEKAGKYYQAEYLLEEVIKIHKKEFGESSIQYAIALNNKALLWQKTGRYKEAKALLEECIETVQPLINEKSKEYTNFLVNQAFLLHDMGEYEEAEKLYTSVLEIKQKRFGASSPEYANLQRNLASLYMEMDRHEEAATLLEKSVAIYQRKFGDKHPSYATTLSYQGKLQLFLNQLTEAEATFKKVEEIQQDILGEKHPDYIATLEDLALVYWQSKQTEKAVAQFEKVVAKKLELVDTQFMFMSEHEKTNFWDRIRPDLMIFNTFAAEHHAEYPQLLVQMYDLHLATKGLLLQTTNKIRKQIVESGNKQLIAEYSYWIDQREYLSGLYSYSKEELADEKINIDSLEQEVIKLEKNISTKSQIFMAGNRPQKATFEDVKASLKDDESAIEIIHFNQYDKKLTENVYYAALITSPNKEFPEIVVLDNGKELESDYFSIYKGSITNQIEDADSYAYFWSKIDEKLDAKTVYLSSDGIYNQLNVNTFLKPDNSYVIDNNNIVFLTSTRQLIEGLKSEPIHDQQVVLFGFPDYGDAGTIAKLPGTKKEVETLATIIGQGQSTIYLGKAANEGNIKALDNPHILHIATHGFFMEDLSRADSKEKVFGIEPEKAIENPLLRAGLLLTDAEDVMNAVNTQDTREENNGILTAYEAMNLKLDETDLVVLSACETGLGNIKSGEGVYGLQRAFQIAGVDAIVMSLWKVSDEATQKLMTSFYKKWKTSGDKQEAFLTAQTELKKEFSDPYYWGAFILLN